MTKMIATELVAILVGSLGVLVGVMGFRVFGRLRRRRQRYSVDAVSDRWLVEQRRER